MTDAAGVTLRRCAAIREGSSARPKASTTGDAEAAKDLLQRRLVASVSLPALCRSTESPLSRGPPTSSIGVVFLTHVCLRLLARVYFAADLCLQQGALDSAELGARGNGGECGDLVPLSSGCIEKSGSGMRSSRPRARRAARKSIEVCFPASWSATRRSPSLRSSLWIAIVSRSSDVLQRQRSAYDRGSSTTSA